MTAALRFEALLEAAVGRAATALAPPKLAAGLNYAVFPGGARVRPHLCLAVAAACGDDNPALSEAAAVSIELLHCASLVHDDLPCFDNAATRRGKPSLQAAFGEPLAVLAGDGLIVLAFDVLARASISAPERLPLLLSTIARGVGMPSGIVAGQAWESETDAPLEIYHRAKTSSLFVAAVTSGALSAGADPAPWRELGEKLGDAYQVADDIMDAVSSERECGKSVGRDAALGRPSAVKELGLEGSNLKLRSLIAEAMAAIPPCDGARSLRELVQVQASRLSPPQLARNAA